MLFAREYHMDFCKIVQCHCVWVIIHEASQTFCVGARLFLANRISNTRVPHFQGVCETSFIFSNLHILVKVVQAIISVFF